MVGKKQVLALTPFVIACALYADTAETFVVKKKEKKTSLSSLKDDCCQLSADIVYAANTATSRCLALQERCILNVEALAQGSKQSFFATADKAQCDKYAQVLRDAHDALQELESKMHEALDSLAALEAKTVKK